MLLISISFGVEYIPKEIRTFISNKNITEKKHKNLFSPNNFKKNDDIILKYFISNI